MPHLPDNWFEWGTVVCGSTFLLPWVRLRFKRVLLGCHPRVYAPTLALFTFLVSVAYVHFYLRGGPRIIDATAYWLQARTFASGSFTFEAPGPLHSFAGRFMVVTPDGRLAVLFPPGYAAILALGVKAGLPLLVNPALGALCALLTYQLGRQWFDENTGRVAGVLSALCAALRYHSADTMSHVWAACLGLALLTALSARPQNPRRSEDASVLSASKHWGKAPAVHRFWTFFSPVLAGLCGGWLLATRPLTGLVFTAAGFLLCGGWRLPHREERSGLQGLAGALFRCSAYGLALLPGISLWLAYQWVTTGDPWSSTQALYYSRSDWPESCFRLGFGANVGCRFEHGDFIAQYQPNGYGVIQAIEVTGRRLYQHSRDVANVPWAPLLSLLTLRRWRSSPAVVLIWLFMGAFVAAYALFYFDGNYPGGGARLLTEILPLQHLLLAVLLVDKNLPWLVVPMTTLGFGLWAAPAHTHVAEREGGRPMFEQSAGREAGAKSGLLFVDTDHGFNLGFDPEARVESSILVARARGDALDYATWLFWNKPNAYRYAFDPYHPRSDISIEAYVPVPSSTFQASSLWPPVSSSAGAAVLSWARLCDTVPVLNLRQTSGAAPQRTILQLWVSHAGRYQLESRSDRALVSVSWPLSAAQEDNVTETGCLTSRSSDSRQLAPGPVAIEIATTGATSLATLTLRPVGGP